jgi:hypothetical protein
MNSVGINMEVQVALSYPGTHSFRHMPKLLLDLMAVLLLVFEELLYSFSQWLH